MIEQLSKLGLTSTEAKIYNALIEHGRLQAGMISRKTGIHRRSVYDGLERLIEKGIVSWIRENEKRLYYAENPSKLKELVAMKEEALSSILPLLQARDGATHEKEETKFYRGKEGIKTILQDQIECGKTVSILGASYNASEILKYYMGHYTDMRRKSKLKLKMIYFGREHKIKIPYSEVAYLPEQYLSPVSTNIYADRVAIIVWSEEPIALLIKNKKISEAYKKHFDLLWAIAKKA
jgi:HTH-type transcriptional regulator, sugar sensing transcriptional regulator